MKTIPTEEAVGMVLCQDITQILPGEFKGPVFKKGHVVTEEDIPVLLSVGKENLYVWENNPGSIHENDAADRLSKAICGANMSYKEAVEGKCTIYSDVKGLFRVNSEALLAMNMVDLVTIATLPGNFTVDKGQKLAGARVVPLVAPEQSVIDAEKIAADAGWVCEVLPYKPLKVGVVTTGSEVYKGRIKDKFGPVIREKVKFYGGKVMDQVFCPDDMQMILDAVAKFKQDGADLIVLTGGMSVDPDDLTPGAIKQSSQELVVYGAPVQPGNMVCLAYDVYEGRDITLVGVPGCAMYSHTTLLDAVLPNVFAGVKMTKLDFAKMGEGGLCRGCKECHYPTCYFCR